MNNESCLFFWDSVLLVIMLLYSIESCDLSCVVLGVLFWTVLLCFMWRFCMDFLLYSIRCAALGL